MSRQQVMALAQDQAHIGEIRYSILTRDQFRHLYGTEWDLMQGQGLETNSELLALYGSQTLPDARGVFLRCANAGRDQNSGDPQGDVPLGTYQPDEMKNHTHGVETDFLFSSVPVHRAELKSGIGAAGCLFHDGGTAGITRTRIPGTTAVGGHETRPRCVIVNAFIKLRDAPRYVKPTHSASLVIFFFGLMFGLFATVLA
jgi:hypothetical protein